MTMVTEQTKLILSLKSSYRCVVAILWQTVIDLPKYTWKAPWTCFSVCLSWREGLQNRAWMFPL